ncbi:MAG: Alpha-2-macroglobulin domain-containing protein [Parcubacteria group bacterium GW2011_GWA2_42_18]|nr:MAG: Alpha-2-macroglobulin domain-containing protein [Parcubacteria group bacterium GW2011_GWA2_42_18]
MIQRKILPIIDTFLKKTPIHEKIILIGVAVLLISSGALVAFRKSDTDLFSGIVYARVDTLTKDRVSESSIIQVSGSRYLLTFDTANGKIGKEFLVIDDPRVDSIIPALNSETNENSNIPIVFNQPIVALSTIKEKQAVNVPISIQPAVGGVFKWVGTRSLQFQPADRFNRSTRYGIKLDTGLLSPEGLPVAPVTHSFITRPLRIENYTGAVNYGSGFNINFNQPFNLSKTKSKIHLIDALNEKEVSFSARYGTQYVDERLIENTLELVIRPLENNLGLVNQWDANGSYTLKIDGAIPTEGDITLENIPPINIGVSDVVRAMEFTGRSNYVSQDFFDPHGNAVIIFNDEIDIANSIITAKGLADIVYDQICVRNNCQEKKAQRSRLILSFTPEFFSPGERIDIQIKKLVNIQGDVLINRAIVKTLTVYPRLSLYSSNPSANSSNSKLTKLILCTSTPLKSQDIKNYQAVLLSNKPLIFQWWDESYRTYKGDYENESEGGSEGDNEKACKPEEFISRISYRLFPLSDYRLSLKLEDVFGQRLDKEFTFKTGVQSPESMRFFVLQKGYTVTQPDKTELSYAAQNFDYIEMDICKMAPAQFIGALNSYIAPQTKPSSFGCREQITKRIPLPVAYWKNQHFTVDLKSYFRDVRGQYILSFGHPNYIADGKRVYKRNLISITNFAVAQKFVFSQESKGISDVKKIVDASPNKGALYWVTKIGSMAPVDDARVEIFVETSGGEVKSSTVIKTDENGLASSDLLIDVAGAAVSKDGETAVIVLNQDRLNYLRQAGSEDIFYIYTDRPIYRPGQEIFFKGIHRWSFDGENKILKDFKAPIEIFDSRQESIYKAELPVNDYGTFSGSIQLKGDAPLGNYRISTDRGESAYFSVEEYKPAAFETTINLNSDEFITGDVLRATIQSKYYFGVPLSSGDVTYQFTSQDYYFDRYQRDDYFDFGQDWYYCYECSYNDQFIFEGTGEIDTQGNFTLVQNLTEEKFFRNDKRSRIIVLHTTARDAQGRTVSAQKSFILHKGQFYLGLSSDSYVGENQTITAKIKSVDIKGADRAVNNISLTVDKISWEYFRRQEADGDFYYTWEQKTEPIHSFSGSTDANGNLNHAFVLAQAGEYEIKVSGQDTRGNNVETMGFVYVYGKNHVNVRPTNNNSLELQTKTSDIKVGDTVDVIIKSPYQNAKALIGLERGRIYSYEIVPIASNIQKYSFRVKEEHIPNIYFSALIISPDPDIKFGTLTFNVDRLQKSLSVKINSSKDIYLPGEKVDLSFETTDYKEQPIPAELSVSVADVSVLALKGNPRKTPLQSFYSELPLNVSTVSNIKNILEIIEIPEEDTKGGSGGGTEEKDLAKTLDTKLGAGYDEFTARKELMATPIAPNFIIPGDTFKLGVKVFNQTTTSQRLTISFASDTLVLQPPSQKFEKTVPAGKDTTVYFNIAAPLEIESGAHQYTISAKNNQYEDVVSESIPITVNEAYENVATFNSTSNQTISEYVLLPEDIVADKGNLTVRANATLAVYLSDALRYMAQFPYGCSEQLASKISALAIIQRGLKVKNIGDTFQLGEIEFDGQKYSVDEAVRAGLTKIYANQTQSGGFAYYGGLNPSLPLTVHILNTFQDLRSAGYKVHDDVVESAANYVVTNLRGMIETKNAELSPYQLNVLITGTYALYRLKGVQKNSYSDLRSEVQRRATTAVVNEKLSTETLAYLAMIARNGFPLGFKVKADNALGNRIEVDARGAFAKENPANTFREYYETTIKDTALVLKALVADENQHPLMGNIIRWLVASRARDGSWESTNNTVTVIDAFTDFLEWTGENKAAFDLELDLDGNQLTTFSFNKNNLLETMIYQMPLERISKGDMHILNFTRENARGGKNYYYDVNLKYYLPIEKLTPRDEGISIERKITKLNGATAITSAKVGNVIKGRLRITTAKPRILFGVEDIIPAGTELINFDLATNDQILQDKNQTNESEMLQPNFKELHRDRLFLFSEYLPAGIYDFDYYLRVSTPGIFSHLPATAREMYFPENFGRTGAGIFTVSQ